MTPQEINERIARILGKSISIIDISKDLQKLVGCPNYYNSLDACREFEKLIQGDGADPEVYEDTLASIVGVYDDWYEGISFREAAKLVYATPAQRCEAFLRMKGQWE